MSNTDNQMTRFLFAILKQKNLKDIDWTAVAHDPILAQPITNGHAARMRYSRFRSSMLGLEPQKRNRPANSKNRVAKPKRDQRQKKEEDTVKPEPCLGDSTSFPHVGERPPAEIKQEHTQPTYLHQFTPASMPSPVLPDCQSALHTRLLTPCSDDMLPATQGLAFSPSLTTNPFDLSADGHCEHDHDHHLDHGHEHGSWHSSPMYSAFDIAYGIDGYGLGGLCEHQHDQSDEVHNPAGAADTGPGHVDIKNEHWDTQFSS